MMAARITRRHERCWFNSRRSEEPRANTETSARCSDRCREHLGTCRRRLAQFCYPRLHQRRGSLRRSNVFSPARSQASSHRPNQNDPRLCVRDRPRRCQIPATEVGNEPPRQPLILPSRHRHFHRRRVVTHRIDLAEISIGENDQTASEKQRSFGKSKSCKRPRPAARLGENKSPNNFSPARQVKSKFVEIACYSNRNSSSLSGSIQKA